MRVVCVVSILVVSRQTGLTGSTSGDIRTMFSEDNVVAHMSRLFDGQCQTRSISASEQVMCERDTVHVMIVRSLCDNSVLPLSHTLTASLTHTLKFFALSLTQSLPHSLPYSLVLFPSHPLTHTLNFSLTRSIIPSLPSSLTLSLKGCTC